MSGGFFMGVDIGSLTCDVVIVDGAGEIASWVVVPTGARNIEAIARAEQLLVIGCGQKPLDLLDIDGLGQSLVLAWRADEQHGVGADVPLLVQPAVEGA